MEVKRRSIPAQDTRLFSPTNETLLGNVFCSGAGFSPNSSSNIRMDSFSGDWDWRCIGKPTPAESLPTSVTMRACAFPGNCFKALFRNKIRCNTLRCHFLSPVSIWMIPYDYATTYLWQAKCVHREETFLCVSELEGKALHVLKNLYSKESGQFELGDEIYAAFAGVLTRADASRRLRTDTRPEGHRGQLGTDSFGRTAISVSYGAIFPFLSVIPLSSWISIPGLLWDLYNFVENWKTRAISNGLCWTWKSKALIKHEPVSLLPYMYCSLPPSPSLIPPVHFLQEPTWCFYSSS